MVEHQSAESHLKKLENEFNHFSLPLLYLFNTHDILMSLLSLTGMIYEFFEFQDSCLFINQVSVEVPCTWLIIVLTEFRSSSVP